MDPPKKQTPPPESSRQDEGFDFELTDLEEARRILDTESISQFDVATVVPPEHWKRHRRAQVPTDKALTGHAIAWLISLPPPLRPHALSQQFPRITNALAQVWHEPEQCQEAFDKLLNDARKGRKGFPVAVRNELVALKNYTRVF